MSGLDDGYIGKDGLISMVQSSTDHQVGVAFVCTILSSKESRAHTLMRKHSTPAKNGGSVAGDTKLIEKPFLVLRLARTIRRLLKFRVSSSDMTATG